MKTLCALAGLVLAAGVATAAEPVPQGLGVNIHFTEPKPGEMEMIRDAGMAIVRMDMTWAGIEKERGVYDFSRYDVLVQSLAANEIRALFILDYGNPLYDQGLAPHTDEGRRAFARFAAAAVSRYKGKGFLWEIWNEPNHPQFWKPQVNVDDYLKLALEASKAIRAVAVDEKIIGPATSTIDLRFLEACFKGGLLEQLDGVSVHPYRGDSPETVQDEYRKLRRLIAQYAPSGKQVAVLSGEWGYTTARPEITAERQGKYLARQWLVNLASDIPVSIWYDWRDDGTDPKETEHNFGTVLNQYHAEEKTPYRPKPAYVAAQTLTKELKGYRFNKRLALERESDWLLLFQKDDSVKLVAWTTQTQPRRVKLPIAEGSFALTSHAGAPLGDLAASEGTLEVELSDGPVYLNPQSANPWLTLLANCSRLEDVVAYRAPGRLQVSTTLRNTTDAKLTVHPAGGASIDVSPGESFTFGHDFQVLRTPYFFRAESELAITGRPTIRQRAYIGAMNPLHVEVRPATSGQLSAKIENPTGQATVAQMSIGTGVAQPLTFAAGETEKTLQFPVPDASGPYTVDVAIRDGNELLLDPPARRYVPMKLDAQQFSAIPDGDSAVKADLQFAQASAAEAFPAAGSAMQLNYRFDEGWKFARVAPAQPIPVEGQPESIGFWVHGDGSNNLLRLRYVDSTGQTFQPNGIAMHFREWLYFEFPLRGEASGHWSGANDGVVHYPIRLDTLFLVDSANRKSTAGTVQISKPVLIYSAQ